MATENARVNLYINKDQFEKAITQSKRKVTELERELANMTEGSKEFAATKSDIDAYRRKIEQMEGKMSGKLLPSQREVEAAVRRLSNELRNMPRNAPERALKIQHLKEAKQELAEMKGEVYGTSASLRSMGGQANSINKSWGDMKKVLSRLGLLGLFAGAGAAARQLFSEMFKVRSEFEKFEAILTNSFDGNNSKAVRSMEMIKELASQTPFSVRELTESYVKLVNQGFTPTQDEMTKLGDLAATTGKQFDQLTEAIIDAQVGEFERLKEFGIRASKEGDNVTFTFRGVEQQVKFTDDAIRDYVLSLGELSTVSGAMSGIAETQAGLYSNLGDEIDQLWDTIGEGNSGPIRDALNIMTRMVRNMREFFSGPQQDNSLVGELRRVKEAMNNELHVMREGNFTAEQRAQLIQDFNTKYNEYLPNLLDEASSLEDIAKYQQEVNTHMQARILYTAYEDRLAEIARQELDHAEAMVKAEKERINIIQQRTQTMTGADGEEVTFTFSGRAEEMTGQEEVMLEMIDRGNQAAEEIQDSFREARAEAEEALKKSAENLGVTFEEMRSLFNQLNEETGESAVESNKEGLKKLEEAVESTRTNLERSAMSAQQREIDIANEKYDALIAEAEELGRNTEDIEELHQQELQAIRDKYAKAVREKKMNDHRQELMRLAQLRDEMFKTYEDMEAQEIETLEQMYQNKLITTEQYESELAAIKEYYREQQSKAEETSFRDSLRVYQDYVQDVGAFAQGLTDLVTSLKQYELDQVEEVTRREGESEEEYTARKEQAEEERLEIAKKYAGLELLMKVSTIIANTAAAIMQGFAQLGPIGGAIYAPIMAAVGGVQIAAAYREYENIQSFHTGGFTGDGSFVDGTGRRVAGVVHDNEYVVASEELARPDIARMVNNIEAVRASRMRGFNDGGPSSDESMQTMSAAGGSPSSSVDLGSVLSLLTDISNKLDKPSLAVYDDREARRLRQLIAALNVIEESSKQ